MGTALRVGGIYSLLVGFLLLFPGPWGVAVFGRPVMDAAVTSGWGASLIIIGLILIEAAADVTKYAGLTLIFAAAFLLGAIDLFYFWVAGAYTARTLVPVALNLTIAAWIWFSRSKG